MTTIEEVTKGQVVATEKELGGLTCIEENEKAMLWRDGDMGYEVWMKLYWTVRSRAGQLRVPGDEDFGCWAWQAYSLDGAKRIFQEITDGTRVVGSVSIESETD